MLRTCVNRLHVRFFSLSARLFLSCSQRSLSFQRNPKVDPRIATFGGSEEGHGSETLLGFVLFVQTKTCFASWEPEENGVEALKWLL